MIEIAKYMPYFRAEDDVDSFINCKKYATVYDYYQTIMAHWEEVLQMQLSFFYSSAIAYVLKMYAEYDKLEQLYNKWQTLEIAANYVRSLARQGKTEELKMIESKHLAEATAENSVRAIEFFIGLSVFYTYTHEFDKAEKLLDVAERKIEELPDDETWRIPKIQLKATLLNERALKADNKDEIQQAIDDSKKGIKLLTQNNIEDSYLLGALYNTYGNALSSSAGPERREKHEKAIEYLSKNNFERALAIAHGNIALVLVKEGKFEEAIENLNKFLKITEKYKEIRNLLVVHDYLVSCYKSLGKLDEAEKYLQIALENMAKYQLKYIHIYITATELYALRGDFDKAEEMLQKYCDTINLDVTEGTVGKAKWAIYTAFIELKKKNLYKAEKLLKEGIEIAREKDATDVALQGVIYLIELLISKFKLEEEPTKRKAILEELENASHECITLLKRHKSIYQTINYQLLLATIYLFTKRYDVAEKILDQADRLSEKYKLEKQINRINKLKKSLREHGITTAQTKTIENKNNLEEYLIDNLTQFSAQGVQSPTIISIEESEPKLIYLLIIMPSGLPCYSYNFKQSEEEIAITTEDLLISGLISAIQTFSSSISFKKGTFRVLTHSDYVILLEPRNQFTVALFSEVFSYKLQQRIKAFADVAEKLLEGIKLADLTNKAQVNANLNRQLNEKVKEIFLQ